MILCDYSEMRAAVWLLLVSVTVLYIRTCSTAQREGSSRLQVTLEGSVLMWTLHWNQTTADANHLIQYSVTVYSSPGYDEIVSAVTTDTVFDLNTLVLREGTYYIQVQAIVRGVEDGPFSEITVYNVTSSGNTSQKTTLTTLAVTVSCVLAAAVVVGSFLFAVTMWRIRSQGRTQNNTGSISHRSEMSTGSCVLCLCRCARRDTTCSAGRMGRDGFHLHTIEAKDKNRRPVPLHLPDRHSRSSELDAGNTSHPAKGKNDDLPYGYISPAEINVPKFRKFTVSEERPQQTQQKQTPATKLPNAYTNVVCGRVSDQPVYRQETSSQNTVSLQDSVDSTSCTTNIEGNYLEIMPP